MHVAPGRRGLARVEAVVLACLVLLTVGLLLPALQRVHAAGRGTACRYNLALITFGTHNYHDTYNGFPPGMDNQYVGPLVHILPFVEYEYLHRNFSFDNRYALYWRNPYNRPATNGTNHVARPPEQYGSEGDVQAYLCPDGPQPSATATALLTVRYGTAGVDYRANDGLGDAHYFTGSPGRLTLARSHYLAVGGDWRLEAPYGGDYRGIFTYNSRTRLSHIIDGTSNTTMFAEMWGGYVPWQDAPIDVHGIPSGWSTPSRSAGFNYSAFGTCPNPANGNCDYSKRGLGLSIGTFGARHAKGQDRFHVAMADGSVYLMPGNLDFGLWTALCGYRDGQIGSPPGLEPTWAWPWSD